MHQIDPLSCKGKTKDLLHCWQSKRMEQILKIRLIKGNKQLFLEDT